MAQDGFTGLKAEAVASVESMQKLTQEIVDSLFSFSELGFQEFETQRYLVEYSKKMVSRLNWALLAFLLLGGALGVEASQ